MKTIQLRRRERKILLGASLLITVISLIKLLAPGG